MDSQCLLSEFEPINIGTNGFNDIIKKIKNVSFMCSLIPKKVCSALFFH